MLIQAFSLPIIPFLQKYLEEGDALPSNISKFKHYEGGAVKPSHTLPSTTSYLPSSSGTSAVTNHKIVRELFTLKIATDSRIQSLSLFVLANINLGKVGLFYFFFCGCCYCDCREGKILCKNVRMPSTPCSSPDYRERVYAAIQVPSQGRILRVPSDQVEDLQKPLDQGVRVPCRHQHAAQVGSARNLRSYL